MLHIVTFLCLLSGVLSVNSEQHHFISADDLVHQIVLNQTTIKTGNNSFAAVAPNKSSANHSRLRLNLVNSFPPDFMSYEVRRNGGFVVHLCIFVYLCLLLAVVIDSYFLPSLQYFSAVMRMSPNISGATLMAFGTFGVIYLMLM